MTAAEMNQAGSSWSFERPMAPAQVGTPWMVRDAEHLYNIQCSEIITLRNEKLHTEA
jgi:hypothetical protein